jgi:hypothetical protein
MGNNSGTGCSTIEEMRESNRALIILSATYWVGADSISAPEQGRYGICPYSLDQTRIKTSNRIESTSEPLVLKQNVPEKVQERGSEKKRTQVGQLGLGNPKGTPIDTPIAITERQKEILQRIVAEESAVI